MKTYYARNGKHWNVNECLQLQREYELLELSIQEIALRHKRTPNAIMYKLSDEGFADYDTLYNEFYNTDSDNETATSNTDEQKTNLNNETQTVENLQKQLTSLQQQIEFLSEYILKEKNSNIFKLFS